MAFTINSSTLIELLGQSNVKFHILELLKEDIKSNIKSELRSESFIKDVLQNHQIQDLRNKIDSVSGRITLDVASYLNSNLSAHVSIEVNKYLREHLGDNVAREILKQLPGILDRDHVMKGILHRHTANLETSLQNTANKVLSDITSSDGHHQLTQMHLDAINKRGVEQLNKIDQQANIQAKEIEQRCNKAIRDLSTEIERTKNLEQSLNQQKEQTAKLQDSIYGLTCLYMITTTLGFGLAVLLSRRG